MNRTDKLTLFLTQQIFLPRRFCKTSYGKKHKTPSLWHFSHSRNVANLRHCLFSKEEMMETGFEMQNRPQTQSFNVTDALYLGLFFSLWS